jgi:hypothetical protein
MKFCPFIKDACKDECALNIEGDCGITIAAKSIEIGLQSLNEMNNKLPDMDGREDFDLFVRAHVSGAIDTYEQN